MRRGLAWALSATVVLTLGALWGTDLPRVVSAIEPRMREAVASLDVSVGAVVAAAVPRAPLPGALPQLQIDPAKRDVFAPYVPPAPPAPPAPRAPVPVAQVEPMPPPPQQAPVMSLRFLGSMVTPAGERLVYLARGDTAVPVVVGERLEEGYVVSALTAEAVTLVYPPMELRVIVPISQPAQQ